MVRVCSLFSVFCLFFFFASPEVTGQIFSPAINLNDSTQQHLMVTQRGDRIVGQIQKIEGTTISFLMKTGNIVNYSFQEIEWVGLRDEKQPEKKRYGNSDPELPKLRIAPELNGCENLLASPSGFNFRKGTGEYRNLQVVVNTADYGFTDHFSAGAGIVIPFIFVLRFKGTIDYNEILHLGAGTTTFIPISEDLVGAPFTHLYGVVTLGRPKAFLNATFGYGFNWGGSDFDNPAAIQTVPLLTSFGGSITVGERLRFIIDVAYLKGNDLDDVMPSFTVGWLGRMSRFELGLFSFIGVDSFALPVLSYARRF